MGGSPTPTKGRLDRGEGGEVTGQAPVRDFANGVGGHPHACQAPAEVEEGVKQVLANIR